MQTVEMRDTKIHAIRDIPPAGILEFFFHGYLVYSMLAVSRGIYIPNVSGLWLIFLAFIAFSLIKWKLIDKTFLVLVLATTALYVLTQVFVFSLPISNAYVRPFIEWLPTAMVVYALVHRPGFIQRLALVMIVIAVLLLPSIREVDMRSQLSATSGIDNSNDYAAWVGFAVVVFWLWSWNVQSRKKQVSLWCLTVVGIIILMLTVSRSGLYWTAISMLVGMRAIPRNRRPRMFLFIGILFILQITSPFIQDYIGRYQARINEDTGRLLILKASIIAIKNNPFRGYGVDRVGGSRNVVSAFGNVIPLSSPHNGIVLLWLSSGITPVIPFILLWGIALWRSFKFRPPSDLYLDALPLVTYAFLFMLTSNLYWMQPYAIAAVGHGFLFSRSIIISNGNIFKLRN